MERIAQLASLVAAAALACDDVGSVGEPTAPTAVAWLAAVERSGGAAGAGDQAQASGRAIFVARAGGVQVSVEADGLEPGAYRIRLRDEGDCTPSALPDSPGTSETSGTGGDLERFDVQVRAGQRTLHDDLHQDLDLGSEAPLVGGSVVVEAVRPGIPAGPVLCGVVDWVGELQDESEGRFQGPPPGRVRRLGAQSRTKGPLVLNE